MQVVEVEASDKVDEGAWILPRLRPFRSFDAGSVIPSGFEAYARIDHLERTGVLPPEVAGRLIEILVRHTPVAEMFWLALWEGYGYVDSDPNSRSIRPLTAVWVGPGEPPTPSSTVVAGPRIPPRRPRSDPRIEHEARAFVLYRGAPDRVPGWWDGPNLWWPDDRSWCVASEIDLPWTYVGGSHALIAEVLGDELLLARPLSLDESTLASDDPELRQRT